MPTWDELFQQEEMRWREPHECVIELGEKLKNHPHSRILDLGCGAGRHLVYLAKQGHEMVGLDGSPRGLEYARQWLEKEGLTAELTCQDMLSLSYPDQSFDVVLSIFVIYHNTLERMRQTIAEIKRVLRPGGMALLTFQSKRSWRYGNGKEIEKDTFIPETGDDAGVPHHYSDLAEFDREFHQFIIRKVELIEDRGSGADHLSSHWAVWLEKT